MSKKKKAAIAAAQAVTPCTRTPADVPVPGPGASPRGPEGRRQGGGVHEEEERRGQHGGGVFDGDPRCDGFGRRGGVGCERPDGGCGCGGYRARADRDGHSVVGSRAPRALPEVRGRARGGFSVEKPTHSGW